MGFWIWPDADQFLYFTWTDYAYCGWGMAPWREKLFISMQRNTSPVSDFYQIPPNRVVELGTQIQM